MGGTDVEDFADRFVAKAVALEVGPAPDELFHYTSSDALTNICKNKSLWLTHAYFMNDTREFLHGMSMFREALDGFKKTPWMSGAKTFFDRDLSSHAKKPFIFSMTKNPDQLSQWRGYGDEGRGVSVGFRTSRLPQKGQFLLRSVVYNPKLQKSIVSRVAKLFGDCADRIQRSDPSAFSSIKKDGRTPLAMSYFYASYLQAVRFKHDSWKEESEWRLIQIPTKTFKSSHRSRDGEIVPYSNLQISDLLKIFTRIFIGPRSYASSQKLALESLRKCESANFKIGVSRIPMKR